MFLLSMGECVHPSSPRQQPTETSQGALGSTQTRADSSDRSSATSCLEHCVKRESEEPWVISLVGRGLRKGVF